MTLSELVQSLGVQEFKARLIAELKILAEQNPDHQYVTHKQLALSPNLRPSCSYNCGPRYWNMGEYAACPDSTEEQSKGCIFGRALRDMGVELGDQRSNIEYILNTANVGNKFAAACLEIQAGQDTGLRWGELNICSLDRFVEIPY
jgi:hypothetical protein